MNTEFSSRDTKDTIWIADLSISALSLFREQRFRGWCILSFSPSDATSIDVLSEDEYTAFMRDLRATSSALRQVLNPDHMNYELLGNSNPHLHWHVIPRYKNDGRWGQPVWEEWPRGEFWTNRQVLTDSGYAEIVASIRLALEIGDKQHDNQHQ